MHFSSGRLIKYVENLDTVTGKVIMEAEPEIVTIQKNGKEYQWLLAHVSKHKNKVVQIFPVSDAEQAELKLQASHDPEFTGDMNSADVVIDGYVGYEGKYYKEYKPHDVSITKNVLALLIAAIIVTAMVMSVVWWYARKGMKAPRKGMGFMEMLIDFIYTGVIKATLHDRAKKFAPFLLTCFFFILVMNLVGLIVIFPGGANLTGNIAVTLVLAVLVFVITNVMGTKHYWKEIFWPDVPLFLKFPIPIMQFIEIFGIFTKPAALCVRLFANMMGGHMIVITLTLLIFIFAAFGAIAAGGSVFISVIFSIFMLCLDVLVSFIQAYVFTLLATIFISMSTEKPHHESHVEKETETPPAQPVIEN
ncbi:MAG: F0F1 ATP synthase subunit A [Muribaculaceae bacterium]|nr:F0F1 ATP synthase subunit A [Muribaculaceae bacterium]